MQDARRGRAEIAEHVAPWVRTTPEEIFLELRSGHLEAVVLRHRHSGSVTRIEW
jgi:hypothetical protein